MQLETRDQYLLALGAFRRSVNAWMLATAGLQAAAHAHDPQGEAEDDPAAGAIFAECLTELRGMAALLPGVRQLLAAALEPAQIVEETAAPHANCEEH